MKRLLIGVAAAALIIPSIVLAGQPEKVTICHASGLAGTTKFETLTIAYPAVYGEAGHFYENGTPRAGHEEDYLGPCLTPSPTPSATSSNPPSTAPSPSITASPSTEPTTAPSEPVSTEPSVSPTPVSPTPFVSPSPVITLPPTDTDPTASVPSKRI